MLCFKVFIGVYTFGALVVYCAMALLAIIIEQRTGIEAGLSSVLLNEVAEQWQ
jgi:hypothetical protein